MKHLETYNGIKIYFDGDSKNPFVTVKENVPVIGVLQTGHKTLEDAKSFIDKHMKS